MAGRKKKDKNLILPVLPLRGIVIFPFTILPFDVGRTKSIKALEEAMLNNQTIFLVAQKDENEQDPDFDQLYSIGTISKVKQLVRLPGDTIRVLVEGVSRASVSKIIQSEPFLKAEIYDFKDATEIDDPADTNAEAMRRSLRSTFEKYTQLSGRALPEAMQIINTINNDGRLADIIASNLGTTFEIRQQILEQVDINGRMENLLEVLIKEIEILEIENEINQKVRNQMEKLQRDYYLREQIKIIQDELGEKEGMAGEIEEYKEKLGQNDYPEEVVKKVNKELGRLAKMPMGSAEVPVIRTYLDWIFDLPWNIKTEERINLDKAEAILAEDHYGLEKVKERILEYLAVSMLKKNMKGPILCLVGPPGVGKTSIAKSIARAVGRKYVRMSLGGVRDEAEIRGHRRTYVGAMPGRILSAIKQAGSKNPLLLFDEIDKMSSDFRGDPASAMLEVLDSEQNFAFRDHYLELPFDLSDVMFITTANTLDTIPRALLDRMEVININGYTTEEKLNIALKYLVIKQLEEHGLKRSKVTFTEASIRYLINHYTREAGVRNLEREIANICRKAAKLIVSGKRKYFTITEKVVEQFLGGKKFRYEKVGEQDQVGIATGLAWTSVGGDTLTIEVNLMPGNGKLELTGHLGDVMKESARAAVSYIRANADNFGINHDFILKNDIHIHVPEGATPKDGPSAGITLATALISALTGISTKHSVAMTGEITLRGRVLPIGGLKEKVLAAHRAGIETVILPIENIKDLEEIPDNIRKEIKFHCVSNMSEVTDIALVNNNFKKENIPPLNDNIGMRTDNITPVHMEGGYI